METPTTIKTCHSYFVGATMNDEAFSRSRFQSPTNAAESALIRLSANIHVATPTGGQGKTTIVQILHYALLLKGIYIDLYSLDAAKKGTVSKLGRVLPVKKEFVISASMEEIADHPEMALQHFDEIGDFMSSPGAMYDFGANVAPMLYAWAPVAGLAAFHGEMPPITLVVPVTAHATAIEGALETIADARKSLRDLPVRKVIIVYNEREEGFSSALPGYDKLLALETDESKDFVVKSITLPKLVSEIWVKVQSTGMNFHDVLKYTPKELMVFLELPGLRCARGQERLRNWLDKAAQDFDEIGLAP